MSSEKGNVSRKRAQKHQNSHRFKNDLHDKTPKTKFLNTLEITDVCGRCKSVLEWRIKYKKYKLLKNPSTCTKCGERNVNLSYRVICGGCATKLNLCPKCGVSNNDLSAQQNLADKVENIDEESSTSSEGEAN